MSIHQAGPPEALAILKRLVAGLAYKPGWNFEIVDMDRGQGCAGTTLAITTTQPDSWDHTRTVQLWHSMPVPAAAYNEQSWTRWLLEQLILDLLDQHGYEAEVSTIDGYDLTPRHIIARQRGGA